MWRTIKNNIAIVLAMVLPMMSLAEDIQGNLLQFLRASSAKDIASYFSDNVSITIKTDTDYYSKFQGEMILSDFLKSNKATEVKQLQRLSNNSSNYYIIYQYKTRTDTFRIFVRFAESDKEQKISEIRIE